MTRRVAAILAATVLCLLARAAGAETVRLQTGEHPGFTRIVLDLAFPAESSLNRTDDGYVLRFSRPDLRFDLSQAFVNIPRTRLGTIWVDPQSGVLQLGVACSCHARVEHLSGDVLVVDLVDGPAPADSAWETGGDGSALPPLQPAPGLRPRSRPVVAATLPNLLVLGLPGPTLPRISKQDEPPLRDDLLSGFAQAAAAGLVEPVDKLAPTGGTYATLPRFGIRPGDIPQVSVATATTPAVPLTAKGAACIADDRLAIENWGGSQPFAISVAGHDSALIGEFDRTVPEGLSAAVRFYLYSGFGTEAAALLDAFPNSLPDAALWRQMARLVDGTGLSASSSLPSLSDQGACQGKAALWAALSVEHPGHLPGLDRASLRQAFSALPPHLRRLLGPGLAERLMNDGDMATARSLIDSIDRAPTPESPAQLVVSATLATREGNASRAEGIAKSILTDAGPEKVNALVALVNAQLAQGRPVDPGLLDDLAAVTAEVGEGPLGAELAGTRVLATASVGDYEQAFVLAEPLASSVKVDLWTMLATGGPDSAILTYALVPASAPAGLPQTVHLRLSERLLDLGFPEAALAWTPGTDTSGLLIAAKAKLLSGDARAAISLIAGNGSSDAEAIRADAMMQLGDLRQAAASFERLGDTDAAAAALWQSEDWAAWLGKAGSTEKQDVAQLIGPRPGFDTASPAPLAQGRGLVADAERVTQTINAILAAIPAP